MSEKNAAEKYDTAYKSFASTTPLKVYRKHLESKQATQDVNEPVHLSREPVVVNLSRESVTDMHLSREQVFNRMKLRILELERELADFKTYQYQQEKDLVLQIQTLKEMCQAKDCQIKASSVQPQFTRTDKTAAELKIANYKIKKLEIDLKRLKLEASRPSKELYDKETMTDDRDLETNAKLVFQNINRCTMMLLSSLEMIPNNESNPITGNKMEVIARGFERLQDAIKALTKEYQELEEKKITLESSIFKLQETLNQNEHGPLESQNDTEKKWESFKQKISTPKKPLDFNKLSKVRNVKDKIADMRHYINDFNL